MLAVAVILLAVLFLSVLGVVWLIRRAPEGHEDQQGFEFGSLEQPAPAPSARAKPPLAGNGPLKAPYP
jgi:hypothetical protein